MSLMLPLGLLGLLGIVALIVIYIIRPNFQQKSVSSTYIWKLSLKYKKKKLPTSKIRNILLFICQVLILALIAWILAKPVTVIEADPLQTDVIAIVDSSASMYAEFDDETRFERAVKGVIELANQTFNKDGNFTVIIADNDPSFLAKRVGSAGREQMISALNDLLDDSSACSYGASDVEAALKLSEEVLEENPSAQIYLYTDTTYTTVPDDITVVQTNLEEGEECNAAILNVTATQDDEARYVITVDLASYGRSCDVEVEVEVLGINALDSTSGGEVPDTTFKLPVTCYEGKQTKAIFTYSTEEKDSNATYYVIGQEDESEPTIYSYQSINVYITVEESNYEDAFRVDNSFMLYGGQKQVLKVQYASSLPNDFFIVALDVLKKYYGNLGLWDIQVTEVKPGNDVALSGYDLYIFEHTMPETIPTDGVVFLVDPDPRNGSLPSNSGLSAQSIVDFVAINENISLVEEQAHALTRYINADDIQLSQYVKLIADPAYEVLMTCNTDPAILVRNEISDKGATQIMVLAFSVHYSNLSYNNGIFITMMMNLFEYFFPATVTDSAFDVNETISLNARSTKLNVVGANIDETYTEFPAQLTLSLPGTYTLTQTTYYDKEEELFVFVKIPPEESDVCREEDGLTSPIRPDVQEDSYIDWLFYLAAALTALIFVEWILKSVDNA